jgi:hypothetical protein
MVSQAPKRNTKLVCGNLARRATDFVSDQEAEAVTLYRAKVIGYVLIQCQGAVILIATTGIVEWRLPSVPSNSAKFAPARLVYSNYKTTYQPALFLLRIERKQICDLLL